MSHRLSSNVGNVSGSGIVEKNENVNFNFHNNYRSHPDVSELMKSGGIPSNGWRLNNVENYVQPLYVNAPPKPRRVTEAPEASPERVQTESSGLAQVAQPQEYAIRNDRVYPAAYVNKTLTNVTQSHLTYSERRTPDTYGRSPSVVDPRMYAKPKAYNPDYEELYNLSASCNQSGATTSARGFVKSPQPQLSPNFRPPYDTGKPHLMNRPHSADFLEQEARREKPKSVLETISAQTMHDYRTAKVPEGYGQPPRPKSSIDIVNSDSFHWSEERYAQNMRKSAQYLVAKTAQPSELAGSIKSDKLPYQSPLCDMLGYPATSDDGSRDRNVYSANVTSTMRVVANRPQTSFEKRWSDYSSLRSDAQGDFIRSKSARIPNRPFENDLDDMDDGSIYKRRNSVHAREFVPDRGNQQVQQVI